MTFGAHRVPTLSDSGPVQIIGRFELLIDVGRISLLNKFQLNEAALRRFSQPVLLVASAADQLLPSVAEVKKLATFLSHATTVILEHSGHACLLEAEINLGQLLEQHLAMAAV